MPAALASEGAFAASNTCLALSGADIFFGTGGPAARVFHSSDSGRTWSVAETPIAHSNASSGIFSIVRADEETIVVVGGDYQDPKRASGVAAYSLDEGKTWQLPTQQVGGYRSAVAHVDDGRWVAVGPSGEDISGDFGVHWKRTDSLNLNAVALLDIWTGWAVGPNGTIARFVNHYGYEIHYRQPQGRQQQITSAIHGMDSAVRSFVEILYGTPYCGSRTVFVNIDGRSRLVDRAERQRQTNSKDVPRSVWKIFVHQRGCALRAREPPARSLE
jgi:hypothetical protein